MKTTPFKVFFFLLFSVLLVNCSDGGGSDSSNSNNSQYWIDHAQTWTKGSGTQSDPFQIESAEQLAYIAKMVNDTTYKLYGDTRTTYVGIYFKLMNNINLSGKIWTPIGGLNDIDCYFAGKFEGNSKIISNIDVRESTRNYVGLFGNTKVATISNLDLISGTVLGKTNTGGIVGHMQTTTMSNCHNGATVTGTDCVGGICGACSSSSVSGSYNTAAISGSLEVGGITGYLTSAEASGTPTVTQSYNSGAVIASTKIAGGLVGYSYGGLNVISFCYNKGAVSAPSITAGIVATMSSGTIKGTYNIGTFTATDGKTAPVRVTSTGLGSTYESEIYYLSADISGDYQKYSSGLGALSATLKAAAMISNLNLDTYSYWKADTSSKNSGYPVLSWQ